MKNLNIRVGPPGPPVGPGESPGRGPNGAKPPESS